MGTILNDVYILNLDGDKNPQRTLSFIQNSNKNLPFEIKRVFYLYDIPGGQSRGAHAHRNCHQLLIAVSGSFEVKVDDGVNSRTYFLNNPKEGLYIPNYLWAAEKNFSSGAICLVFASDFYEEDDYIREYGQFLELKNKGK
jgi:dTDP-4-dehydrorhamnose 3,5-epimerase-like enzyme